MDQTNTETGSAIRLESASDDAQLASGTEINLGDFTRTQGLVKSLRLTIDQQVVVPVEEIASGVSEAGRKFKMGDIEQAHQDVARLYASFGQRTGQWEGQARGLEQQLRMQAAKNPKSVSIDRMNRMKSEQTAVRSRIRTADVQFRRLHQGLDQAFTMLQSQPSGGASLLAADLPPAFLASFEQADAASRPGVVSEHFATEGILKVTVTRAAAGGYAIKFDPTPPPERLYFLTATNQVICLRQLSSVVLLQDVETGKESEWKLVDFVRHVQAGVWLLRHPT